jgi:hyaluronoglucosaminidase
MSSPFNIRGVVEGFYGPPYTFPERDGLIAFMGRHGLNYYLYGPKNDRQHRNRWREPYPDALLAKFAGTVAAARQAGVRFCYAVAPSVSVRYADEADFALICAKLGALYDVGVRDFCVFFDDISAALADAADRLAFDSPAAAHAALTNRLLAWLWARDPACTLSMVPTDYSGVAPFSPYLHELGERLRPEVDIFYTGHAICSATIGVAETRDFAAAVRRPPIIWDNYPVNDLAMRPELHLGPLRGREPGLGAVARGFVAQPMLQANASQVPLATVAAYLADPHGYEPWAAWGRALAEVAGESAPALRAFAECALRSTLGGPEAPRLERLTAAAMAALHSGEPATASPALAALEAYIFALDAASYHLKNRMENLALRAELLPWIDALDCWYDAGWRAIAALRAIERGEAVDGLLRMMRECYAEALGHHKRYAGRILAPLVEHTLGRCE